MAATHPTLLSSAAVAGQAPPRLRHRTQHLDGDLLIAARTPPVPTRPDRHQSGLDIRQGTTGAGRDLLVHLGASDVGRRARPVTSRGPHHGHRAQLLDPESPLAFERLPQSRQTPNELGTPSTPSG
jgi:hypothetical protein